MKLGLVLLALIFGAASAVQAQISFNFNFSDAAGTGFNDAVYGEQRRGELVTAANALASYFTTTSPRTVTYKVVSFTDPLSFTLASATSGATATAPGFYQTIVQAKILTGVDANGAEDDGFIEFNLGQSWGYGSSITSTEFDFQATAMHELLHSFGFASFIDPEGKSDYQPYGFPDVWTIFDTFITDINGTRLIDPETLSYNGDLTLAPLTSGMFFAGPNAVAAYGGQLVPLYAPDPWEPGSSGSHTDDEVFTGMNPALLNARQIMNAVDGFGLGVRYLSGMEMGMMEDIGYTVVPEPGTVGLLVVAGGLLCFLGRKRLKLARSAR